MSNLDGTEAKLQYLKAWQALPEFGITTFLVKFKDSNKKEVGENMHTQKCLSESVGITWYCFQSSPPFDNLR